MHSGDHGFGRMRRMHDVAGDGLRAKRKGKHQGQKFARRFHRVIGGRSQMPVRSSPHGEELTATENARIEASLADNRESRMTPPHASATCSRYGASARFPFHDSMH